MTDEQYCEHGQTYPPTKRMHEVFTNKIYPVNQTMPHPNGEWRQQNEEKIDQEKSEAWERRLNAVREAAEIHRQVRQDASRFLQPGMELKDVCERLEATNLRLLGYDPNNP